MTRSEAELIEALNVDIQSWEWVAQYFSNITEILLFDGKKMSGEERAKQIHDRIREHRKLIDRIKGRD